MKHTGFTIVELLIVMAILSILSIVAISTYSGARLKALRTEAYSNLESLRLLEEQFFADNGRYTDSLANVAAIQAVLRGFQPGEGRMYNYAIIEDMRIVTGPGPIGVTTADPPQFIIDDGDNTNRSCFVATAIGIAGTPVENDFFAIDCQNNRNF